ncbi:MAG: helicase-related protein [Candidatus Micrarchaeota archaeon]|nr:helicase-related protein [Candidatus Micrarchaeota archaeon]
MAKLEEIITGVYLNGLLSTGPVKVLNVESHGKDIKTIYYIDNVGQMGHQVIDRAKETSLELSIATNKWTFDADPKIFKLASEAKRIKMAYIFDPMLAVHTSKIRALPHQITAVYDTMLNRQPLRFLLADDPGAGKTIMAGLLIKELMARGDVKRCLIVAPGGLVEQWQDELSIKFNIPFDIITRDAITASRTGNPFSESDLVIARLDQLSRFPDVQAKAMVDEWDMIIFDEAHKLAAHFFGRDIKETKRYKLGKNLAKNCRHLLLMTATPHNGKEEDFQLFLQLLDNERFEGKYTSDMGAPNVSDIMCRRVKEDLLTFEEKPLFPERRAYTKAFLLSLDERNLYEDITSYVKTGFQKAERLTEGRRNVIGFALTVLQRRLASSPEAIYQSLKRRREKLKVKLQEWTAQRDGKLPQSEELDEFADDLEDLQDLEDNPDQETEEMENKILDKATLSESIPELESEIEEISRLEESAKALRDSENDSKWDALRDFLDSQKELRETTGGRKKLIIFTEHRDTLTYLETRVRRKLGKPGAIVTIHGGTPRDMRKYLQDKFTNDKDVQILIATDAAGEGINLQRANLMINYDVPWNPNRIEQRFGRIHRIGQIHPCILWNFIAKDTREGDVFQTLFDKLEEQRRSLGGRVFDVLGKVFTEKSLTKLILDSIQYSNAPERKAYMETAISGVINKEKIEESLRQHAIGELSLSKTDIARIRDEFARAEARKLQPHFIGSFFIEAFENLSGIIRERESNRYEIKAVPAQIRQFTAISRIKVLPKYERICFDRTLEKVDGKPDAEFISPGHPLFDSVLEIIIEKYGSSLKQGAILKDVTGKLTEPALLYYVENAIDDERKASDGSNVKVSRQFNFVYYTQSGKKIDAGYAPYLDCKPCDFNSAKDLLGSDWLKSNPEGAIVDYALSDIFPAEFEKVKTMRESYVERAMREVKTRLNFQIHYWSNRAYQLKKQELSGNLKNDLNSGKASHRADDLSARMERRLAELEKQRHLIVA